MTAGGVDFEGKIGCSASLPNLECVKFEIPLRYISRCPTGII